jgi:lysozyme
VWKSLVGLDSMTYNDYLQLRYRLAISEGFRDREYLDTATPPRRTIGYGYNVSDRGVEEFERIVGRPYDGTITKIEATRLLEHDLVQHEVAARRRFPWLIELSTESPVRYGVVIDMVFNMGIPTLATFRRTLESVEIGEYDLAAVQMLQSKWARQVKGRATRLAAMMKSGRYYE